MLAPVLLGLVCSLSPPDPGARLVELPIAERLRILDKNAEAEFLNVAPEVRFDHAIVSYNGNASNLEQIEVRTGSLQKVGKWSPLVKNGPHGKAISDIQLAQSATRLDLRIRLKSSTEHPRMLAVAFGLPKAAPQKASRVLKATTIPSDTWRSNWGPPDSLGTAAAVIAFWRTALGMDDMPATLPSFISTVKVSPASDSISSLALAAGQFRGVLSYGSFFLGMGDLELWIGASLPVICRVGQEFAVVVGFDARGNPQTLLGGKLRVMDRKTFTEKWATSGYAVVLIHPNPLGTPESTRPDRWLNKEHDG